MSFYTNMNTLRLIFLHMFIRSDISGWIRGGGGIQNTQILFAESSICPGLLTFLRKYVLNMMRNGGV